MTLRSKAQADIQNHQIEDGAPVFELWQGLQVQITSDPLKECHLDSIAEVCRNALTDNSRLICFDFYLKLSPKSRAGENNAVAAFLDLLIHQLQTDLYKIKSDGGRSFHCRVRYLWMKMPVGSHEDYRVLLLLNRDAYFALEKKYEVEAGMTDRINDAWMKITGSDCWEITKLIRFPGDGCWQFTTIPEGVFLQFRKAFFIRPALLHVLQLMACVEVINPAINSICYAA